MVSIRTPALLPDNSIDAEFPYKFTPNSALIRESEIQPLIAFVCGCGQIVVSLLG
jgi:hypothetical protein